MVEELQKGPSKLKLGGERREMINSCSWTYVDSLTYQCL